MSDESAAGQPTISLEQNGPLKVSNLETFKNSRGEPIKARKTAYLCRCGASKNKPFCDGTHAAIGFTGDKEADRVPDQLDEYRGKNLTVRDNRGVCSHAGHCTRGQPHVWRSIEPWIDPDGADKDAIIDTIRKCPSGALSYAEADEVHADYHTTPEIQISPSSSREPDPSRSRSHGTGPMRCAVAWFWRASNSAPASPGNTMCCAAAGIRATSRSATAATGMPVSRTTKR